ACSQIGTSFPATDSCVSPAFMSTVIVSALRYLRPKASCPNALPPSSILGRLSFCCFVSSSAAANSACSMSMATNLLMSGSHRCGA
ncbi:hypothetical protein PENTCL1PPCAC_13568, partial [Pristionchus entomophagus]